MDVAVPITVDGVREVVGRVDPASNPRTARELLAATRLSCQKGGEERTGTGCVSCERFVNFRPSADRSTVVVRCQWRLDDPVADLMTCSCELAVVEPDWRLDDAVDRARRLGISHLLVTRRNELVGIVACGDAAQAAREGAHVADHMQTDLVAIPPTMTLGAVAALMGERDVGCLPIVVDGKLVGVVTRGDLRAVGMSDAQIAGSA